MNINERIRMLRKQNGMSQDELAKKVGYAGRSAINKIELGQIDLTQSKIKAFADAFGVTPTYLLDGDETLTPLQEDMIDMIKSLDDQTIEDLKNVLKMFQDRNK